MEDVGLGVREAVVEAAPGTDYVFVLDGAPLPDPASRWQPEGIRGPSRLLDAGAFTWTDKDWVPPAVGDLVLYELHVGTFTAEGTFEAAIGHLSELRELGVTAIELMPVGEFPGRHGWGYDGVYLSAAQSSYGGPARPAAAGRRRAPRRPRRAARRRLQPRRRVRDAGADRLRPVLHEPLRDPLGQRRQLRRRALGRRARVGPAERRAVGRATSTSTACGSTPSTRSRTAARSTSWRRSPGAPSRRS